MNFDYQRAQASALRLIARFGQVVTLIRASSDYDAGTGRESNFQAVMTAATVVSLPASSGMTSFDNRFKEDLKRGKIRFFFVAASGLGFEPNTGDTFIFENKIWDLAGVSPLNPAGTPVLYAMAGNVRSDATGFAESMTEIINSGVSEDLRIDDIINFINTFQGGGGTINLCDLPPLP